jgi:DNA-binding transcriptional ArsR family regulator
MEKLRANAKTWIAQLESGEIKSKKMKVLNYIRKNPTTNLKKPKTDIRTMCHKLDMVHQSLTSSLSNLEDAGLVKVIGDIQDGNKHYSIYEYVKDEKERLKLMEVRFKRKFQIWVRKAERYESIIPKDLLREIRLVLSTSNR